MKCIRCERDIEADAPTDAVICGNCADDLRAEQDAIAGAARAEAEDIARQEYERDRQVYEEEERSRHVDNGGGYRYV